MAGQPDRIGRYEVSQVIGRGGMGVLYRARDSVLDRDVAIKVMMVDFEAEAGSRERFQREARAIARLQHRNVVTIHELGETDGTPYIVMEFLGGRDLETMMRQGAPPTLDEKLDIVIQLLTGLAFAHEQGVVHRDIKPANVRVLEDGTVKILDFGIAKFARQATTTTQGLVMGTASYMSPEQASGEPVDGRADIFSAGVLLYELLSGRKPFQGDSPTATMYQIVHADPPPIRSVVGDLPEQLGDIVARALKKNPDHRYSRATDMAADVQIVRAMTQARTLGGPAIPTPGPDSVIGSISMARPSSSGSMPALDVPMRSTTDVMAGETVRRGAPARRRRMAALAAGAGVLALAIAGGVALLVMSGDADIPLDPTTRGGSPAIKPEPPPPPPPAPLTLTVTSTPDGARIAVDGKDTGKVTPAAITLEGNPPWKLEVTRRGYESASSRIDEADLKAGARAFTLEREAPPVRVTLTGAYPFEVLQGSRVLASPDTSHQVTVSADTPRLRLRNREYFLDLSVEVRPRGDRATIDAPDLGTISVVSRAETCQVTIDGIDVGFPPVRPRRIAAGSHTVAQRCDDDSSDSRRVSVSAGALSRVVLTPRD